MEGCVYEINVCANMKVAEVKIAPESEHGKLENDMNVFGKRKKKGEKRAKKSILIARK